MAVDLPGLLEEVGALYAELEKELPQGLCAACGKCCHFRDAGHILFVTGVERVYFEAKHPGFPLFDEPPEVCPFLKGLLCTAREGRTLACRNHFCCEDRNLRERRYEKYLAELRRIGRRLGIPYDYSPLFMKSVVGLFAGDREGEST